MIMFTTAEIIQKIKYKCAECGEVFTDSTSCAIHEKAHLQATCAHINVNYDISIEDEHGCNKIISSAECIKCGLKNTLTVDLWDGNIAKKIYKAMGGLL